MRLTVAYGRVNNRLAEEVSRQSKGKITIDDYYLELIPTDLQHAYEEHSKAKEEGDIALTKTDFERIPEYLDSFTEVLYAIKYSSGSVRICVSKELPNGRILIIETVSKSRGAIQFKNAIGVSEDKYIQKYLPEYKKRAETNTRGSESSNISLRDSSNSTISIRNDRKIVNNNSSGKQHQDRTGTLTNRDIIAEIDGQTELERAKLKEYQEKLDRSREQSWIMAEKNREADELAAANNPANKQGYFSISASHKMVNFVFERNVYSVQKRSHPI